jgi:hypothetical protein
VENMPTIFSVEGSKKSEWARTPFANGVTFLSMQKGKELI